MSFSHDVATHADEVDTQAPNTAVIRLGINILNALPSQEIYERLIERYDVFEDIVSHKPTIKITHRSFWDTYKPYLTEPKDPAKLSIVSEEMCRNVWSMLDTELPKNRVEWITYLTGRDFRWEWLGVLIAMFGLAAISLPDWFSLLES